jgi:hypothetical protein
MNLHLILPTLIHQPLLLILRLTLLTPLRRLINPILLLLITLLLRLMHTRR